MQRKILINILFVKREIDKKISNKIVDKNVSFRFSFIKESFLINFILKEKNNFANKAV